MIWLALAALVLIIAAWVVMFQAFLLLRWKNTLMPYSTHLVTGEHP